MTFVRKFSGDQTTPIIAVYTCPEHGEFDAEVARDENGEAPDRIQCPHLIDDGPHTVEGRDYIFRGFCELDATWTPSATVGCRVRRIEVTRGKWEKPERNTYLDTRKLGEGQDPAEFQAERKKMWREKRMRELKDL
jgi:hypothetical protein